MTTQQLDDLTLTDATKDAYLAFVRELYVGEQGYCATSEFSLVSALERSTRFFASCWLRPVIVRQGGRVVAAAVLIHDRALHSLQVAFFEAVPGVQPAVDAILAEARAEACRRALDGIVVGLNGHLSVGVGILTDGFRRGTFSSPWNKPYYAAYFSDLERHDLTAFGGQVAEAVGRARAASTAPADGVTIRTADPRHWDEELERFRVLCDATLGTTDLYAPTTDGHFADLMGDLVPFLRPENLLFAVAGGRDVGFVFWHPDYNEVLPTGRRLTIAGIAWRFFTRRRRIRTVVINAIGTLADAPHRTTATLVQRLADEVDGRFDTWETCFVWDGNGASRGINSYLGASPTRRYAVWTTR